ncbi:MAG: hypothetical protein CMA72_07050 [Euryarchaeota archaeon]|nr:hypothetical protein [Euryarchaeota archaeon]|tara:strand:+ start:34141 stop:34431 length:291 start_codon:yes stop_codon:yes gene_type:complete
MNVSWDFFSKRRRIDLKDFVSKFSSYNEICEWCEAKGVNPPSEAAVKVILNPPKPKPVRKPRVAKPKAVTKATNKNESRNAPPANKTVVGKKKSDV